MFKHILNFMRTGRPILPDNFGHLELLLEEARYYELQGKITRPQNFTSKIGSSHFARGPFDVSLWPVILPQYACISDPLAELTRERRLIFICSELVTQLTNLQNKTASLNNGNIPRTINTINTIPHTGQDWEVVALNVSPEMGERIMISGVRDTIEEVFPEISHTLQDTRHSLAWNSTSKYVIRSVEKQQLEATALMDILPPSATLFRALLYIVH